MALVVGTSLALLMAAIAISDWRYYRVPDPLSTLALALRGVDLALVAPQAAGAALLYAALRAAVAAMMFYLIRILYQRWRGREGLGLGDVKLAAIAGAWVDWPLLPYVVECAALVCIGMALVRAWRTGGHLRADTRLPFAVGFAPAIFVGWQLQSFLF